MISTILFDASNCLPYFVGLDLAILPLMNIVVDSAIQNRARSKPIVLRMLISNIGTYILRI